MTESASTSAQQLNAPWRASLTRPDVDALLQLQDWRSWVSIGVDWGIVSLAMGAVATWPNPISVVVALFMIGARQLGLAVLMHEASHRTLLSDPSWNDRIGNWLCAYPIWADLHPYRAYHLKHHAKTGGPEDPDLGLVTPFPVTRRSLWRKIGRDLSGRTGIKFARAAYARTFGRWGTDEVARRAAIGFVVTNLVLVGLLTAVGYPALYLLWVGAWLTTNTLVTRIRSIAEHALTPDADDPLGNTRTTLASWWERLLIAPNRVNYHLEHHLLMTVPHYHLPRMHVLLRERGIEGCVQRGYAGVLARAASGGGGDTPSDSDDAAELGRVNGL